MPTLSGEQIGVYIWNNGAWGPGGSKANVIKFLDTAIAVALAESSGNTDAVQGGNYYGLFQISKSAHPELFKGNPLDPATNVEMAHQVWKNAGNSFRPWQTYTNNAYKSHLGYGQKVYDAIAPKVAAGQSHNSIFGDFFTAAMSVVPGGAAVAAIPGVSGVVGDAAGAVTGAAGDIAKAAGGGIAGAISQGLSDVMTWLQSAFLTIGAALLAIILLILGIWFLISETKAGAAIKSAGKDAAAAAVVA